jgi:2,4-dienoyl-CoA reductase-like NADH-dependent reductase (Old Yellow Enzyme family)
MLFTPLRIGSVTVRNRIAKSAMAEGRCDQDGRPLPSLIRLYDSWARGGVGLCITGMAHVRRGYSFTGGELGLYDDCLVEPLRELTSTVHRHGGHIFAQICWAPPQLPRSRARALGATAPSAGFNKTNLLFDRELSDAELVGIVADFGAAARRAREAGFDGIELHGAHGYLISRMLSPKHNRRADRWGGDFGRRIAFVEEVINASRRAVGRDFPIAIKLNVSDGERGGLELDEGVRVAKSVAAMGVDAIEVSAGTGDVGFGCYPNKGGMPILSGKKYIHQNFPALKLLGPLLDVVLRTASRRVEFPGEAYFEPLARRVAEAASIPVICVGGIRSLAVARRIVTDTPIAMVAIARPLVRQPDLPNRWREGSSAIAACTSCNECFTHVGLGMPLVCRAVDRGQRVDGKENARRNDDTRPTQT